MEVTMPFFRGAPGAYGPTRHVVRKFVAGRGTVLDPKIPASVRSQRAPFHLHTNDPAAMNLAVQTAVR